jgi:signal transduction histidine kinase
MSRNVLAMFSLRRINVQIAALILGSLVLMHLMVAGYVLLNWSKFLADSPLQKFELIAKIVANATSAERGPIVQSIGRTFPELKLRLKEGVSAANVTLPERTSVAIPSTFDGRVDLIRGLTVDQDRVWFYLPNELVLEATIGSPRVPAFVRGLLTSTVLFLVASVTLLGVWARRSLSSPLSAFARAAEEFSLMGSAAPLSESGPEEIRQVARALNRMRERITALMNDRTRMLAAISHDLRTPITRLRLRSEYIEDETQRTQTVRDLDQMQSMLESVLSLMRSESAARPTLVDIAALLVMVCEQFSDVGHAVSYEGPDRATATVRADEIVRAVTNLIDNATRYAGEVRVVLMVETDGVVIDVCDNGPGIPDEKKAAVLEPFVRGEEARTMDETGGFGLGLSIARAIVTAHGGSMSLMDNMPTGLRARLLLPLTTAADGVDGRGRPGHDVAAIRT